MHVNRASVARCTRCGYQLSETTTQRLDESSAGLSAQVRLPLEPFRQELLEAGQIAFVIGMDGQPLIETGRRRLILGRRDYSNPDSAVDGLIDLTWYFANVLGVSRRHAAVEYHNDGYALMDLGSVNGTWLNEQRLRPKRLYELHSGDGIQLGLMTLTIYFAD